MRVLADDSWIRRRMRTRISNLGIVSHRDPSTENPQLSINSNSTSLDKPTLNKRNDKQYEKPEAFAKALSEKLYSPWIEQVFHKRECIKFIPDGNTDRCGCGRLSSSHSQLALSRFTASLIKSKSTVNTRSTHPLANVPQRDWNILEHTQESPTDAFGTIEFQGGTHAHKAHYVRLGFDSDPEDIMYLMEKVWGLQRPRLVITVHGGTTNFQLPDRLGRLFREGLLKAAMTTGAWLLTSGIDSGVVRQVATGLDEAGISARMRSKVVTIGVAPWGLVKKRERLVGKDTKVPYEHYSLSSRNKHAILNDRHSYFLLVDNGTVGRYGADIVLRKRLEEYIAAKEALKCGTKRLPIICVVLEGGISTINSILQYLTSTPAVPVIVCEGSGRASDIIAFADKWTDSEGHISDEHYTQLVEIIRHTFDSEREQANSIADSVIKCVRYKELLTVFRPSEDSNRDVDQVILRALLKGQNLSAPEQLSLTLAWDRVDIARAEIFVDGQADWSTHALHSAMMDALLLNRVEFVKLLLENGVSLKRFLTINRLEQLYNAEPARLSILYHLLGPRFTDHAEVVPIFTLPDIGETIEKLVGNAFRSHYTTRGFKSKYEKIKRRATLSRIGSFLSNKGEDRTAKKRNSLITQDGKEASEGDFKHPFNDLMLWAVLTRRHEMAKCFWLYGEEAMAKALTAIRLYRYMSRVAADDYTEVEVSNILREHAEDFRELSFELLNHCYQQDGETTMRLLTAELPNWGHHTCLSLAVISNVKRFLAHPCCQILLAELWHGGLRFRSQSNFKVILAVLFPPTILWLDFKAFSHKEAASKRSPSNQLVFNDDSDSEDEEPKFTIDQARISLLSLHLSNLFRANASVANRILFKKSHVEPPPNHIDNTSPKIDIPNSLRKSSRVAKRLTEESDGLLTRQRSTLSLNKGSNVWKQRFCDWKWKLLLFYSAPITSFWIWAISFSIFMLSFIYVLLIEFPMHVTHLEWFQFCYVLAVGLEHFRKLLILESSSFVEKVQVFYNRYWNILTTVSVLTYFIGFAFRFNPETVHTYSRVILASNSVLWHMKMYDYLSVHPRIGPYITMAGKMVLAMSYIIIMLLVCLMAFGVARQSITFPHEKWNWLLVRNIFYKPYFMLYGEVYAGEIDTCGDEGTNCVPGGWIPPILMTVFLIVANILLINMLIAIFKYVYKVKNSNKHINFLATSSMSPMLFRNKYGCFKDTTKFWSMKAPRLFLVSLKFPAPFTPIVHLFLLVRYLFDRKSCSRNASKRHGHRSTRTDFAIKISVDADELKRLHDFEEDCMDDFLRRKHLVQAQAHGTQNSLQKIIDSNNELSLSMKQIVEENAMLKMNMKELQENLQNMRTNQANMQAYLRRPTVDQNLDQVDNNINAQVPLSIRVSLSPEHPIPPGDAFRGRSQSSNNYSYIEEPTHSLSKNNHARFYNANNFLTPTWYSPPLSPHDKRHRHRNSVSLSEELAQMLSITGSEVPAAGAIETPSVRSFIEQTASSSESLYPNEVIVHDQS
uniref:Uncharacterized protein n=1 Tax=Acrobeloides nanus TaxID=290746 RepID=A0A914E6R5_9BILA